MVEATRWDGVAAFGLSRQPPRIPWPSDPVTAVTSAGYHKLVGLLDAVLTAQPELADDALRTEVGLAALRRHAATVRLEARAAGLVARLTGAGFDVGVLKGPAWAHTFEVDPAWREFRDLDLLVRGDELAEVERALAAEGFARPMPPLGSDVERTLGKGFTLRHPDGTEVDVHRTLAAPPLAATVDPGPLFDHRHPLEIAGTSAWTLDPAAALVHAALHVATKRRAGPAALRDLARIAAAPPDPAGVAALARRWQVAAAVTRAVALAGDRLAPPPDLFAPYLGMPASRRDRTLDWAVRQPWSYRRRALAMTATIPGWRERARWVAAHLRRRAGLEPQGEVPARVGPATPTAASPTVGRREQVTTQTPSVPPMAQWQRQAGWATRVTSAGMVAAHVDDPHHVVEIAPVGELVWIELDRPVTDAELRHRLADAVPDGRLTPTLSELVTAGLVVGPAG